MEFAIETNDREATKELIKNGAVINKAMVEKAAKKGLTEIVESYLKNSGDQYLKSADDGKPFISRLLTLAVDEEHVEVARVLLDLASHKNVDILHMKTGDHTPLQKALRKEDKEMVSVLLEFGELSDQLTAAVYNAEHDTVEEMCKLDNSLFSDITFDTVKIAVRKDMVDVVNMFIQQQVNKCPEEMKNAKKKTIIRKMLRISAWAGQVNCLTCLLTDHAAHVSYTRPDTGSNILHWVAQGGSLECANILVETVGENIIGQLINCKEDIEGATPVLLAAQLNNTEIVQFLYDRAADINKVGRNILR